MNHGFTRYRVLVNQKLSLSDLVEQSVATDVAVPDPGPKAGDLGAEAKHRYAALQGVRAALDTETVVRDAAARMTSERAATALWLGASLADLAAVTGTSRQAARKRWPELGAIHRRRRWLANHIEEILWAARLVLDHVQDVEPGPQADQASLERATRRLRDGVDQAVADFESAETQDHADTPDREPAARWKELDELVDQRLRALVQAVGAITTGEAEFAFHGARGVLAYYDSAVEVDADANS